MSSPSSSNIEQTYEPVEIAALMRVKVRTVRMWLRDPKHPLKGTKIGSIWRVKKSDLAAFMEGNKYD